MNAIKFPILTGEIARRGIRKSVIAQRLGIEYKSLNNKLSGRTEFTWAELLAIQAEFFPDMKIEDLMS
jgi:hypothetical protein